MKRGRRLLLDAVFVGRPATRERQSENEKQNEKQHGRQFCFENVGILTPYEDYRFLLRVGVFPSLQTLQRRGARRRRVRRLAGG